ncbi:MAG: hypothetical protein K2I86_02655 [Prevotella sp.]|nr:hypothetical protein [Prevotella sp.]
MVWVLCSLARHIVPTRSAYRADALRTRCGRPPHMVPTRSVHGADGLRTMCRRPRRNRPYL